MEVDIPNMVTCGKFETNKNYGGQKFDLKSLFFARSPTMPLKKRVLKTYGRHKFRTIKTHAWVNSPLVCSSKDESSDFDSPKIRKPLATCTNLPKSQWNLPIPKANTKDLKTFRINGKENIIAESSLSSSSSSSPEYNTRSTRQVSIPETPPWSIIAEQNNQPSSIFKSRTVSIQISPVSFSSLASKGERSIASRSPNDTQNVSLESPQDKSDLKRLSCTTSTPLYVRTNSKNSEFRSLQNISDCQVFVEHLKLTPDQYEAVRSSMSDADVSKEYPQAEMSSTDSLSNQNDEKITENDEKITENDEKITENDEKSDASNPCNSSVAYSSPDLVTECVVTLKKLRLSPFKTNGKLNHKRLCVRVSLDNSSTSTSSSSTFDGNIGTPLTPPRNQSSHISLVDVVTPYRSIKNETPVVEELDAYQKLLLECEQDEAFTFKKYLNPSSLRRCVKIGEGVYGEVFRTVNEYKQTVALKIIPINGDFVVNEEPQKSCEEILHEIIISKELSELTYGIENPAKWSTPNFISVHRVSVIQDKYPGQLLKEWIKWDKRNSSENDNPDIFPLDQMFVVFEFANGGQDLENFQFKSMKEAISVVQQITLSLAIAEGSLDFEHRDLHWGNVLIVRNNDKELEYNINSETITINSHGVHVSIIDFTLSRLKKDGVIVFCNLSEDESLFTGQGDYQFDIYRQMRQINGDDWEAFTPATNVLWLHYLVDKIMKKTFPSRNKATLTNLTRYFNQVLEFQSAREIIESTNNHIF